MEPLWKRLPRQDGKTGEGRRDDMAALTGINATDLSAMNQGNRPFNLERAARIRALFPGETVYLGDPDERRSLEDRVALIEQRLHELVTREEFEDAVDVLSHARRKIPRTEPRRTNDPPHHEARTP